MTVWMKVTDDEYELPIVIADSAAELARMLGCSANSIYSSICRFNMGYTSRYRKVEIDQAED